jgi:hypothetical protein
MNLYPQAPQSIGKVLDTGFSMYRAVLKPILPLSLLLAVLAQLPQMAPYLIAAGGPLAGLAVVVGFFVWFVAYLALYNGWIISTDSLARGGPALKVGQAFSTGLPKVLTVIGAVLLYALAVAGGTVLLVVPGLILMISLFFFWYLALLENQGAIDSLKGSHRLVWGNWWRTVAVVSVGGLVYFVAYFIVFGISAAVLGLSAVRGPTPGEAATGPGLGLLVFVAAQIVLNAVLMPMWNSLMLVLFRELQLRKSGADLAARAAAA